MKKAKLLKLAAFIAKLKPHKLDMDLYADFRGSRKLIPTRCKSAACALGWATVVFPRELKLVAEDGEVGFVVMRHDDWEDSYAGAQVFDVPQEDADQLFGAGQLGYETPAQVAATIRRYVKTGVFEPEHVEEAEGE